MNLTDNKRKLIIIIGPTASGKSDLAIKIARKFNGEIISADSRQVYRGMDIGTGKVTKDSIKNKVSSIKGRRMNSEYISSGIKHHLLDVASPKKQFTASDFKKLGEKAIKKIIADKKMPIIVGGTGFYIDTLLGRMNIAEIPPDMKLRARLEELSTETLFDRLIEADPARSETIDRHNRRRLIRALEIAKSTKKQTPPIANDPLASDQYDILWLGINPSKDMLAKRIKMRLDERLDQGMIDEISRLHNSPAGQGLSWKKLDDFGLEYRHVSRYLRQFSILNFKSSNKKEDAEFKNSDEYKNLLRDIIRYSKRQMTWFKRNKEIRWITGNKNAELLARRFLD